MPVKKNHYYLINGHIQYKYSDSLKNNVVSTQFYYRDLHMIMSKLK